MGRGINNGNEIDGRTEKKCLPTKCEMEMHFMPNVKCIQFYSPKWRRAISLNSLTFPLSLFMRLSLRHISSPLDLVQHYAICHVVCICTECRVWVLCMHLYIFKCGKMLVSFTRMHFHVQCTNISSVLGTCEAFECR